jgi:hypothetical protein
MQVTNVRVSFLREKQPAQYEKAAPAVEFAAALDEGEDHENAARELMISATKVVYNGLGYDVPPRVAQALAEGKVPAELSVATEAKEVAPEAPEPRGSTIAESQKPRGRPKGSKNTAPKKETAAAKRKREEAEAAAKDDGIPGDDEVPGDEPTPNISTGGDRVNPEDGIPGEDEAPAEETATEFGPKDLHVLMMSHVNATPRTLSVANAKQVLAHFKVARAQDLTNEQALEGKAMVEKMIEATAAKEG